MKIVLFLITISKKEKIDAIRVTHHLDNECNKEAICLVKEIPQRLGQ